MHQGGSWEAEAFWLTEQPETTRKTTASPPTRRFRVSMAAASTTSTFWNLSKLTFCCAP